MHVSSDEGRETYEVIAHTAVVANLPYSSTRLHLAEGILCDDGLLDLFLFSDVGKAEMLTFVLKVGGYVLDDQRIAHTRVRWCASTQQPMPVMATESL